jgi:hypothetical protein
LSARSWCHVLLALAAVAPCTAAETQAAGHVDIIRAGSQVLRQLPMRAFTDTVRGFQVEGGFRTYMNTTVRTAERRRRGGADEWVLWLRYNDEAARDTSLNCLRVSAGTFALIEEWSSATQNSGKARLQGDRLVGHVTGRRQTQTIDAAVPRGALPAGLVQWIVPFLPLAEGYAARFHTFNMWNGGSEQWIGVHVAGTDTIPYRGRPVACWRVSSDALSAYDMTQEIWISKRDHRALRTIARSPKSRREAWEVTR